MKAPRQKPGVRRRALPDGESVAVSADGGKAVVLNPLGAIVLELCDGQRGPAAIVALIAQRFADVPGPAIAADVETLLSSLTDAGIVEDVA